MLHYITFVLICDVNRF